MCSTIGSIAGAIADVLAEMIGRAIHRALDERDVRSTDEAHARRAVYHARGPWRWGGLAIAAWLAAGAVARAEPRPPRTLSMRFQPGDAQAWYVETSFGLWVSHDDGCSFRWICDAAIAHREDVAPTVAVARDGAIFATTTHGLRVSRDGGCSFTTATVDRPAGDPGRIALWSFWGHNGVSSGGCALVAV